ncbi:CGNR zinc finger domain-containing protein [Nocardia sp. NPDC052566]|uniref:CGNR zinc finger domain-containing protein n=1 Tax=Nocardia sp. NPDC052566 TaxID=3364330 RepID=UPI0037CBF103
MYTFVSGNLALDFAGTVKGRTTYRDDLLVAPSNLAVWTVSAGLLDDAPDCDADTLARAVRLREATYRLALASARDLPLADADRKIVNDASAGELPRLTLRSDGTLSRTGGVDSVITAVARSAAELIGGPERALIKECGIEICTRLYVDTSRGRARRWCDMTLCGNRAKAAGYRIRQAR